jgi:hypothetical protein
MSGERTVKKAFKNIPEGKRFFGKPRKRFMDDVVNYLKKKEWRKIARVRDACKLILKESRVLHAP